MSDVFCRVVVYVKVAGNGMFKEPDPLKHFEIISSDDDVRLLVHRGC